MSDKSVWQGLGNLVGLGKSSDKPTAITTRRCRSGHPMAADWRECLYCKANGNVAIGTRVNPVEDMLADVPSGPRRGRTTRVRPLDDDDSLGLDPFKPGFDVANRESLAGHEAGLDQGAPPRESSPVDPAGTLRRGMTRVDAAGMADPQSANPVVAGRRLAGIVVTFTWSALGRIFEVRDGRNFIGSGGAGREAQRELDIVVPEDSAMSGVHCLILCQNGKMRISDCNSTNGTWVDEQLIDTLGVELVDGAVIRAGATVLWFQKIVPVA